MFALNSAARSALPAAFARRTAAAAAAAVTRRTIYSSSAAAASASGAAIELNKSLSATDPRLRRTGPKTLPSKLTTTMTTTTMIRWW